MTHGFFRASGAKILLARTPLYVGSAHCNDRTDRQADREPDILLTPRLEDYEIIADGVETPEQQLHLINLGCQTGQGSLYSKAVAAVTVDVMLMAALSKTA